MEKYYSHDESAQIVYSLLNDECSNEFYEIKDYLFLFQQNYFKSETQYFNQLVNFLYEYKEDLDKIDYDFLKKILEVDLRRLTVPTDYIFKVLLIIIDKEKCEFDKSFCRAMFVIIDALTQYNKSISQVELYDCYLEFIEAYNECLVSPNYKSPIDHNMSYDIYMASRFIMAYVFYFSKSPSIIKNFINNYLDYYIIISSFCSFNNVKVINMPHFFVDYVLSFNDKKSSEVIT